MAPEPMVGDRLLSIEVQEAKADMVRREATSISGLGRSCMNLIVSARLVSNMLG